MELIKITESRIANYHDFNYIDLNYS